MITSSSPVSSSYRLGRDDAGTCGPGSALPSFVPCKGRDELILYSPSHIVAIDRAASRFVTHHFALDNFIEVVLTA